mmetsp:Transcript_10891/g.31220  ORF Transcript_10891/g.31220 Transcript_10891/m.31220 type:complete len:472 (+) Transcript_10891:1208-2623(+)
MHVSISVRLVANSCSARCWARLRAAACSARIEPLRRDACCRWAAAIASGFVWFNPQATALARAAARAAVFRPSVAASSSRGGRPPGSRVWVSVSCASSMSSRAEAWSWRASCSSRSADSPSTEWWSAVAMAATSWDLSPASMAFWRDCRSRSSCSRRCSTSWASRTRVVVILGVLARAMAWRSSVSSREAGARARALRIRSTTVNQDMAWAMAGLLSAWRPRKAAYFTASFSPSRSSASIAAASLSFISVRLARSSSSTRLLAFSLACCSATSEWRLRRSSSSLVMRRWASRTSRFRCMPRRTASSRASTSWDSTAAWSISSTSLSAWSRTSSISASFTRPSTDMRRGMPPASASMRATASRAAERALGSRAAMAVWSRSWIYASRRSSSTRALLSHTKGVPASREGPRSTPSAPRSAVALPTAASRARQSRDFSAAARAASMLSAAARNPAAVSSSSPEGLRPRAAHLRT